MYMKMYRDEKTQDLRTILFEEIFENFKRFDF